jgi:3',5'-cyclic AMP phosphodiesterase CpdA
MLVIAHVSDTHFDGGPAAAARSRAVMDYLARLSRPIDAILVTGDIADHGLPAEYEEARKILTADVPVLVCPGNHDVRGPFRDVLLGEPASDGPINRLYEVGGAAIALCDSSIPGRPDGLLDDETLGWLDAALAGVPRETPAFVGFHHPPVTLHQPLVDGIKLNAEQRLAEVLARHPHVVAVLTGHAHTGAATTFAGLPLRVAPGVASTVKLPWEPGDGLDRTLPPAFSFHILDGGRLTTHHRALPI